MEEKRPPVIVHVGYPKAASTFLQGFFSEHDEVDFRHVTLKGLESPKAGLEDLAAEQGNATSRVKLLSNEKMAEAIIVTGDSKVWFENRFVPGAWEIVEPHIIVDPWETARRVKAGFGADKVLLVLREQTSWLVSAYKFFLPRLPPKNRSFQDFFETPRGIVYFRIAHYDESVAAYADVFGSENVRVLRFEDLVNNKTRFSEKCCDFLSISPRRMPEKVANEGSTDAVARFRASFPLIDKLPMGLKRKGRNLLKVLSSNARPILSEAQISDIEKHFSESNHRLEKIIANTGQVSEAAKLEARQQYELSAMTKFK